MSRPKHPEIHKIQRVGWLRAAVMGANDGIVSTASLLVGVAAAGSAQTEILIAGLAGLIAGAMSMAAGEYVSVSSQTDAEEADTERERLELAENPESELKELTGIYVARGLDAALARQVAEQLTVVDALGAHRRDELGITGTLGARPVQAAVISALTFALGAAMPLAVAAVASEAEITPWIVLTSLVALCLLGAASASTGGAGQVRGAIRVLFWGALAMAMTATVGTLVGAVLV